MLFAFVLLVNGQSTLQALQKAVAEAQKTLNTAKSDQALAWDNVQDVRKGQGMTNEGANPGTTLALAQEAAIKADWRVSNAELALRKAQNKLDKANPTTKPNNQPKPKSPQQQPKGGRPAGKPGTVKGTSGRF